MSYNIFITVPGNNMHLYPFKNFFAPQICAPKNLRVNILVMTVCGKSLMGTVESFVKITV